MKLTIRSALILGILAVIVPPASAALTFYYDPLTGNVSFDTAGTRSGVIYGYSLALSRLGNNPLAFRTDNLIRLSNSTILDRTPFQLTEAGISPPLEGLYTIGDVLPIGLDAATWSTRFASMEGGLLPAGTGSHLYVDVIGGGTPPPATFAYGRPEGQFENRTDLLDPDTLPWATRSELIYDARTGKVVINTAGIDGGYTTGFHLKSDGAFLPAGFAPSFETDPLTEVNSGTIFAIFELLDPARHELGAVLPAGLSAAEFAATFTQAKFYSRAGYGLRDFEFIEGGEPLNLVFVPEASSGLLGGVALAAVGARLRRRRGA
jgi:hypothetical protein